MHEKKDGDGVLFKNDRKASDSHPDYTGDIYWEGQTYWLSAWLNEGKSGRKYLRIRRGDEKQPRSEPAPQPAEEFDDDIPF